jgi:hypothetical protein
MKLYGKKNVGLERDKVRVTLKVEKVKDELFVGE